LICARAFALFCSLAIALPVRAEGNGLLLSDTARLHLSFETEARYDSLAAVGGIGSGSVVQNDPSDLIIHLRPGLRLDAPGAAASFTGSARLDYQRFTGLGGPTQNLSYLGAFADAGLDVSRGGPVSFHAGEHFSRSDQTTNPALGLGSITDANTFEARLAVKPGGGALEGGLGYAFALEQYELHFPGAVTCTQPSCNGANYGNFGSQTHRGTLDARLRFLPKTAVVADVSWATRFYQSSTANVATRPLRAELGLVGLLTEKIRVILKAGYENTFSSAGNNFQGPIAQAEVGWQPVETTRMALGALRTAEPVSDVYGWYDDLRLYASGSILLAGKLLFTFGGNADRLSYANGNGRLDTQGQVNSTLEYELTRYLRGAVGGVLTKRSSSEGGVFSYTRGEGFVRVTLTY